MPGHEAMIYPALGSSLCKRHTGDVVYLLQPGWRMMQDEKKTVDHVIDDNPASPLLLWSGAIRPMPQGNLDNPASPLLLWSGAIRPMPQGNLDATGVAELIF